MIWMWEARAAPGRLADLRTWAIEALAGRPGEVYVSRQSTGDLVVLILRPPGPQLSPDAPPAPDLPLTCGQIPSAEGGTPPAPLPPPPAGLVTGAAHAWPFHQVHPPLSGNTPTHPPAAR